MTIKLRGPRTPKSKSKPNRDSEAPRVLSPEVLPADKLGLDKPSKSRKTTKIPRESSQDHSKDADSDSVDHDSADSDSPDLEEDADEAAYQHKEKPEVTDLSTLVDLGSNKKAVSSTDPFRRYLEEVRRYPLLGSEDEMALAVKLRDTGDIEAARSLVSANLRLVVKIALEYKNFYSNLLDLVQEGNIGLMKAVSKFDPTKGARLGYYASWWIRSYILKYLLDNFRLVKVGTTQAQKKLFYHLMREKERLEAQGLLAGPKLLAEKLHVREKDVIEMEQRLSGRGAEMSLDLPVDKEGSTTTHMDLLVDQKQSADEQLAHDQLLEMLKTRLPEFEKSLNERELKILQSRILAEEPKTLQEVADQYGLTRERARQIEARVVTKLREFLKEDLGETE